MAFKEINSKEEFEAAINGTDKYVFIFIYENEISEAAKQAAADNHARRDNVAEPYAFDINLHPEAREHIKASKYPVVVLFKDGKEVAKVEEPNEENTKIFESIVGA